MVASIVRFFNKPVVHIISGIIIILCGLSNMEDGINEFTSQNNLAGDRIGLLFLGLTATLTKGVLSLFKFVESTVKGTSGLKRVDDAKNYGLNYVNEDVVVDGDLVTARTGGHCNVFAQKIISILSGKI